VATRADSAWAHIDIEPDQLRAEVTAMRAELDAAGATRSASTPNANGFNRARAKRLYDVLFGAPAIQAVIADKPRWLLSVDGVLLSLPFAALVTETPMDGASGDADPESLRTTRWLGAKHTLSVLPGVSHLRTARAAKAQQAVASDPLFAVGDPAFTGAADATRTIGPSGNFFRAGAADVEAVRNLPRLIGTLIEVVNVRALLKAPAAAALLGHDATEAHVRARADAMARARVVLFATHGLVAGDFGLSEPALALTPPPLSVDMPVDPNNDGLLTASEIAFLPLRADWVILSACNTASGAAGAEGLSGLARAFFYAGAKSLLVSHWRVRDETAADLTTAAVTIANEGRSRADAVREAMARIRDDRSRDASGAALSHPAAWAPFAYVGVD
jgi:CHAT domain-containing protein